MKKIILLASMVGICGLAHATTINAPNSLKGANALDGSKAYAWGIAISVPAGQTVTSAQIDFTNIKLTAANSSRQGYLYTDLLNPKTQTTGVTTAYDGDAPGDYWSTKYSGAAITSLGTKKFASVGTTLTWSYILNSTQLAVLNTYLLDGYFSIGLDPDCHYEVGGISFTYTLGSNTPKNSVPEVTTTAFLLALGLFGVECCRRKLAFQK